MNNHTLYGPAPQIIFAPAVCVVIDNPNYVIITLTTIMRKGYVPDPSSPRQTHVCRLPRPSTGIYKSITKSFMKLITKSFMKMITQLIFEQEIAFWVNVHSTLVFIHVQLCLHVSGICLDMSCVHVYRGLDVYMSRGSWV